MSRLTVYPDNAPQQVLLQTENLSEITNSLKEYGVNFERWEAAFPITASSTAEEVLNAYSTQIERLKKAGGYQVADVINMSPNHPDKVALRQKFLSEHQHSEDEVRFFVDGEGQFWFNLGDDDDVFCVTCQAGDLISVPAHTRHWFDMGPACFVKAIRVFIDPSGWVPHYTGSGVDLQYKLA